MRSEIRAMTDGNGTTDRPDGRPTTIVFVPVHGSIFSSYLLLPTSYFLLVVVFLGCAYSFKGGSVPAHLKTIAIPIAQDQSGYGDPTLRDEFTSQLVRRFTNDNTLQIADRNAADSILECVLVDVKDAPAVVQAGEQVSARRVSVTVRVTFQDLKLRKKVWEKDFNGWGDYPSGGGLTQRNEGVKEAVRKLTEDVLNETVAGW